jgi:hypothetical protein
MRTRGERRLKHPIGDEGSSFLSIKSGGDLRVFCVQHYPVSRKQAQFAAAANGDAALAVLLWLEKPPFAREAFLRDRCQHRRNPFGLGHFAEPRLGLGRQRIEGVGVPPRSLMCSKCIHLTSNDASAASARRTSFNARDILKPSHSIFLLRDYRTIGLVNGAGLSVPTNCALIAINFRSSFCNDRQSFRACIGRGESQNRPQLS